MSLSSQLSPQTTLKTPVQVLLGTPLGICHLDDLSAAVHPVPGLAVPPSKLSTDPGAIASSSSVTVKKSEGGVSASTSTAAPALAPPPVHVLHIATSPDGSFVAAYTSDARVHVFLSGMSIGFVAALLILPSPLALMYAYLPFMIILKISRSNSLSLTPGPTSRLWLWPGAAPTLLWSTGPSCFWLLGPLEMPPRGPSQGTGSSLCKRSVGFILPVPDEKGHSSNLYKVNILLWKSHGKVLGTTLEVENKMRPGVSLNIVFP